MVRENSKTQAKASVYMEGRIPIEGDRLGEFTVVRPQRSGVEGSSVPAGAQVEVPRLRFALLGMTAILTDGAASSYFTEMAWYLLPRPHGE